MRHKHLYFSICAFFLYIMYMTKSFATSLPADFDCVYKFSFLFQTLSSFVCILLFLPVVFRSRHTRHHPQPVKNWIYFIIRRLCAGFFFVFGSCYFFNSIAISQKFLNVYKTNITPVQIGVLAVLTISLLFFLCYFRLPNIVMQSFLGIFLFLLGVNSLYYSDISFSTVLIGELLNPEAGQSGNGAFIFKVTHLFLFVLFWLLAVKINQLDSRYFKNHASLWFETLLLNCLASFLLILFSGSGPTAADMILRVGVKSILNQPTLLFGAFLLFSIMAICIFGEKVTLGVEDILLDKWLSSVLILITLLLLYDYHLATFLLKVTVITMGIYLFWKQKPVLACKFKFTGRKRIVKFFVSCLLVAPVLIWSVLRFFGNLTLFGGRWFLNTVVDTGIAIIPVLKASHPFLAWLLATAIKTVLRFFVTVLPFLENNFFVSCFLLTCFLVIYFYRYHTFGSSVELLLRYTFGCFVSCMAVEFLMQYELMFIIFPSEYLPWLKTFLTNNEGWLVCIKLFLLLSIFVFSLQQGIQKGKRLILWTIVSNLLLYLSLSNAVYYGLAINIGADVLHLFDSGDIAPLRFIIYALLNAIPLFILLLLLLVSCNKSIERRILPSLLRCRFPWISEKRKINETVAILREKGLWLDNIPIQIYISQIAEMNAYTIGNKAIAITYPLFCKLSSQQIAGIISHELGHIQHSDGRLQVFLYILNLPSTLIQKIFKLLSFRHTPVMTTLGCVLLCVLAYTNSLTLIGSSGIGGVMIWFLLQTAIFLMENLDTQESEWRADAFAASNGLGQELKEALKQMATIDLKEDVRESWMERYPDLTERIRRLETPQNLIGA